MKYKNKKTGEVIDIPCTLCSNVWEQIDNSAPTPAKEEEEKPAKKKIIKKSK